jgi:sugar O-acyltransferase (sialic acid O-acetyltransferase NeuD family)
VSLPKCLVIGSGGHARTLVSILLENNEYAVVGILETRNLRPSERILGISVIGHADLLEPCFREGVTTAFLALGDNGERATWFKTAKAIGYDLPNLISRSAYIGPGVCIGEGNQICHRAHLGPLVSIGCGNLINTGAILEHETVVADFCHLAPASLVAGRCRIGSQVFIGASACVIDRITIGDRNIIGAGGVVVRGIGADSAPCVGVPAKPLLL